MKLALLGSTGSIGIQTLSVVEALPGKVQIVALAAGRNVEKLSEQIKQFRPALAAVAGPDEATQLNALIKNTNTHIVHGESGLRACITESGANQVVNALVGAVGLAPTLNTLEANLDLALANKESLVIAGELVQRAKAQSTSKLIPIDSEHSALWQLLEPLEMADVEQILITASGGSLRDWPLDQLSGATPTDVLAHPNWAMGARITVDSATLVNKAFEVIEAEQLFDVGLEQIKAVLHPQSLVHGMVSLNDGATLAHVGMPDMRVPIQYALTAPNHLPVDTPRLDWSDLRLDFLTVDAKRYPAFETVLAGHQTGGTCLAALNAADEVLVQRFLKRDISFTEIATGLDAVLHQHKTEPISLSSIQDADHWAREWAAQL